ncbi:MAG: hypothetical protein GXP49_05720 [Deltaproteobacteria bacterium]|nr:hypothetical protein [Deltaproteobacteria bacterium]
MNDVHRQNTIMNDRTTGSPAYRYAVIAVFFVYAVFGLADLSQAWLHSHHGWAGARRSMEAVNYLKYGYTATGLKPLDNLGRIDGKDNLPRKQRVYWHHPPLVMVYLSVVYKIFGQGEIQAKLAFLLLSFATFFLLHAVVKKAAGPRTAFVAMAVYTLIPIQATYINWVNFETMELFFMALMIYSLQQWIDGQSRLWGVVMSLAAFAGIFTDYPALPFCFYFFILLVILTYKLEIMEQGAGILDLLKARPVVVFPLSVLISFVLLLILMASFKGSANAFFHLAQKRSAMGPGAFQSIMRTWNYYIDLFTPFVFAGVGLYILILPVRAVRSRLDMLDAYILLYLLSGVTFIVPLKEWLIPHEFGVLYLVPVAALSTARALDSLCSLFEGFETVRGVLLGTYLVMLFIYSLPIIQSKHVSPMFEYKKPVYGSRGRARFHFQYMYRELGRLVKDLSKPAERILIKKITWKPWAEYYFDREAKSVKDPYSLHRLVKSGKYALLVMGLKGLDADFADPILRQVPHIRYRDFVVMPLKPGRLKGTVVKVERKMAASDLSRYFTSNVYTGFKIEDDPVRSMDYAKKLGLRSLTMLGHSSGKKADPLIRAVALYNKGKSITKNDIARMLQGKRTSMLFGKAEFLGAGLKQEPDGRTRVTAVFKANSKAPGNYGITWRARSESDRAWLRRRLGTYSGKACFDVPTIMWKPGMLYLSEFYVDAPFEKYRLSLEMNYIGGEFLRSPKDFSSRFRIKCRLLRPEADLDRAASDMARDPKSISSAIDMGGVFLLAGCTGKRNKGSLEGRIIFTALRDISEQYDVHLFCGKAGETRVNVPGQAGKTMHEGQQVTVGFKVPYCPASIGLSAQVQPEQPKGFPGRVVLGTGSMGVKFPLAGLVELDAYRWLLPWLARP